MSCYLRCWHEFGLRSVGAGAVVGQEGELGWGSKRVESPVPVTAVVLPHPRIVVPPMTLATVSALGSPLS